LISDIYVKREMALSNSDIQQIETIVRNEVRDFLDSNTIKQFENRITDKIRDEIRRGKIQKKLCGLEEVSGNHHLKMSGNE